MFELKEILSYYLQLVEANRGSDSNRKCKRPTVSMTGRGFDFHLRK